MPPTKLITQNLYVSAARCEHGGMDWGALHDLATFIDLFCLHDHVAVLGRRNSPWSLANQSAFLKMVAHSHFTEPVATGGRQELAASGAAEHLLAVFPHLDESRVASMFHYGLERGQFEDHLSLSPDGPSDVYEGRSWLQSLPDEADINKQLAGEMRDSSRGPLFLLRTFLYVGYADITEMTLTPDLARVGLVSIIAQKEATLRTKLLQKIDEGWRQHPEPIADDTRRYVSMLASVVLKRAEKRGGRKAIPDVLIEVREALEPMRRRLQKKDKRALSASWHEGVRNDADLGEVLAELGQYFGGDPDIVSLHKLLALAGPMSEIPDEPHKVGSYVRALLGFPLAALRRMRARLPVIEIYRLSRDAPGPQRLREYAKELFPELRRRNV